MSRSKLIGTLLLNFLVMPGAGHFIIKRKVRGTIIAVIVMLILVVFSFHIALILKEQMPIIAQGEMELPQMLKFATVISQNILIEYASILKLYVFLLALCYIFGAADLFWMYYESSKLKAQSSKL